GSVLLFFFGRHSTVTLYLPGGAPSFSLCDVSWNEPSGWTYPSGRTASGPSESTGQSRTIAPSASFPPTRTLPDTGYGVGLPSPQPAANARPSASIARRDPTHRRRVLMSLHRNRGYSRAETSPPDRLMAATIANGEMPWRMNRTDP